MCIAKYALRKTLYLNFIILSHAKIFIIRNFIKLILHYYYYYLLFLYIHPYGNFGRDNLGYTFCCNFCLVPQTFVLVLVGESRIQIQYLLILHINTNTSHSYGILQDLSNSNYRILSYSHLCTILFSCKCGFMQTEQQRRYQNVN